jgi:hypothetical protein
MNTQTKTIARASTSLVAINGAGKAKRELAFMQIAVLAYSYETGKAKRVDNLRIALGSAPTEAQIACARREDAVGITTVKLPAAEFPKGCTEGGDRLEFVRTLFTSYAAPPKEGAKANKLRAGQLGRRTAVQQRVIRNAEEMTSKLFAELSLGKAKTESEVQKGKAKRKAQMVGSKGKSEAPTHASLVKPETPLTAKDACDTVMQMATSLQSYANKNAKLLPTAYGMAVVAFKQALNKAANEQALRDATK